MPGDLNLKKSWNPALVKNQKKVWEREQEALKEYQSIKQRSKEIAQEREKEELIRLQYGNDTKNLPTKQKLELNKLSWMYEDVGNTKEPKVNEAGFREVEEDFLKDKDEVERLLKGSGAMKKKPVSRFDQVTKVGKSNYESESIIEKERNRLKEAAKENVLRQQMTEKTDRGREETTKRSQKVVKRVIVPPDIHHEKTGKTQVQANIQILIRIVTDLQHIDPHHTSHQKGPCCTDNRQTYHLTDHRVEGIPKRANLL
ncbi:N-terminal domain of CBF1 interacting co-repressor CIR family protein [Clavispora lusitaniae]|uniref:N-terminal domain of CBF1 interacting co-repressor CIR family protein n=1 Tax=Clavispora lusitaniae TaxID=36911 RepID=UPI00202C1975|nr:N-terminal domain of CBF1 interacting co-repressor CIR family protein [Clavispora lusitaniae]